MIKALKNRRGNGTLLGLVIVLAVIMTATVVYEYLRLTIIAQGVRDAMQSAIISVAVDNMDEVYNGLREGYSGGYLLDVDEWEESIDLGDIYAHMADTLGLSESRDDYIKFMAGDAIEYTVSNLDVDFENAPFAPGNVHNTAQFIAEGICDLEVPLSFGLDILPPMKTRLRVTAKYVPKF